MTQTTQTCSKDRKFTSLEYEIARKYNALSMRENNPTKRLDVRQKISISKTGKRATEITKLKMSLNNVRYWKDKENPRKGAKFYNNGEIEKMLFPNEIPEGWVKGRLTPPWNKGKKGSGNCVFYNEQSREKAKNTRLQKYGFDYITKMPFFTIIKTRKTYSKNSLSRYFPEFRQYF